MGNETQPPFLRKFKECALLSRTSPAPLAARSSSEDGSCLLGCRSATWERLRRSIGRIGWLETAATWSQHGSNLTRSENSERNLDRLASSPSNVGLGGCKNEVVLKKRLAQKAGGQPLKAGA